MLLVVNMVVHYKIIIVAKGSSQEYGLSYGETFTHVAKMTYIHHYISIVTSFCWSLYQFDEENV